MPPEKETEDAKLLIFQKETLAEKHRKSLYTEIGKKNDFCSRIPRENNPLDDFIFIQADSRNIPHALKAHIK